MAKEKKRAKLGDIAGNLSDTARVEYDLGIFVTMRPMPNPDFDAYMAKIKRPQLRAIRRSGASGDQMNEIVKAAIAHTVVVSIEGLDDDDGNEVEYNSAWGMRTFKDPRFYDFYQFIRTESADMGNFLATDRADAAGN